MGVTYDVGREIEVVVLFRCSFTKGQKTSQWKAQQFIVLERGAMYTLAQAFLNFQGMLVG